MNLSSIKYTFNLFKSLIITKFFSNIIKENSDFYDIFYYWHGTKYKIRILKKKIINFNKIIDTIYDHNNKDITDDIIPYLGPKYDFHGLLYTPLDLGYKHIIIEWSDESIQKFDSNDLIKF